jgi:hypothetical protein
MAKRTVNQSSAAGEPDSWSGVAPIEAQWVEQALCRTDRRVRVYRHKGTGRSSTEGELLSDPQAMMGRVLGRALDTLREHDGPAPSLAMMKRWASVPSDSTISRLLKGEVADKAHWHRKIRLMLRTLLIGEGDLDPQVVAIADRIEKYFYAETQGANDAPKYFSGPRVNWSDPFTIRELNLEIAWLLRHASRMRPGDPPARLVLSAAQTAPLFLRDGAWDPKTLEAITGPGSAHVRIAVVTQEGSPAARAISQARSDRLARDAITIVRVPDSAPPLARGFLHPVLHFLYMQASPAAQGPDQDRAIEELFVIRPALVRQRVTETRADELPLTTRLLGEELDAFREWLAVIDSLAARGETQGPKAPNGSGRSAR